jgi:predicted AlkP superfamily pyrophosphatase or phosphodiesterase
MNSRFGLLFLIGISACQTDPLPCPSDCIQSDFPANRKVLIIGIDGCRTDALQLADTPTLDSLSETGMLYIGVNRGPHTVSAPGWSALLTGVWSDKHGVTDNSYDGSNFQQYPDLFSRLKDQFPCGRLYYSLSHPIVAKGMLSRADHGEVMGDDALATTNAIQQLGMCYPDVLFVHLDDIDKAGHSTDFSPFNPEYIAQIEDVDGQIRSILTAFKTTYPDHERLVFVGTDHGGEGGGHGGMDDNLNVTHVFMIASTNVPAAWKDTTAEVVDMFPTIFQFLELPVYSAWHLDGKSLLAQ